MQSASYYSSTLEESRFHLEESRFHLEEARFHLGHVQPFRNAAREGTSFFLFSFSFFFFLTIFFLCVYTALSAPSSRGHPSRPTPPPHLIRSVHVRSCEVCSCLFLAFTERLSGTGMRKRVVIHFE